MDFVRKFLSAMWETLNPTQELSLRTGFHVVVENSANLAAFAELLWGAGSGEAAALVCRILNPETVILSDEVLTLLPNMMSLIVDSFQSHALNINADVKLINGNLGILAAVLGSAALILGQSHD